MAKAQYFKYTYNSGHDLNKCLQFNRQSKICVKENLFKHTHTHTHTHTHKHTQTGRILE
jgi:hypothetical protein